MASVGRVKRCGGAGIGADIGTGMTVVTLVVRAFSSVVTAGWLARGTCGSHKVSVTAGAGGLAVTS